MRSTFPAMAPYAEAGVGMSNPRRCHVRKGFVVSSSVNRRRRTLVQEKRPDLLPAVILASLVAFGVACWWLVPAFMHVMKHQDCVASGRMNC